MIPILYSNKERDFVTNGFGSLSDAATCIVTEERNGQFELEMTYPVTGRHYSYIVLDNIVFAKPSEDKNPQPFQIYDISTPIDGIITIKAHHISYRLSYIPITPFSISGATRACESIKNHEVINNPFILSTDISNNTSKMTISKPMSFRECLGGVEGSFLDIFGGEIEWDKFEVKIKASRGQDNNVHITYSKNLQDFTNDESNDDKTTAILPYWCDSETGEIVVCGVIDAIKSETYKCVLEELVSESDTTLSIPDWEPNKYYELKKNGKFYKNDFLIPKIWQENTYYKLKKEDKYQIPKSEQPPSFDWYYDSVKFMDTNPPFVTDKYYRKDGNNYILLTDEPSGWSEDYNNYYYRIPNPYGPIIPGEQTYLYQKVTKAPNFELNKYYRSVKTYTIVPISDEPPEWKPNKYYSRTMYIGTVNYTYSLLTIKPYDWDETYYGYYTRSEVFYLLTEEPAYYSFHHNLPKWNTNCTEYYTRSAKYFSANSYGYFKVPDDLEEYILLDTDNMPEYVSGRYYILKNGVYVLVNNDKVPSDWTTANNKYYYKDIAPEFQYDKYYSAESSSFTVVPKVFPPDWEPDKYYALINDEYVLTDSKPTNWDDETNPTYMNYYTIIPNTDPVEYESVPEIQIPSYESDKYYIYDVDKSSYILVKDASEPSDWSERYYLDYYLMNSESYSLLTSKPNDWNDEFIIAIKNNYESVPTYKAGKYYRKETGGRYVLLNDENPPDDWRTKYNNYYHGEYDYGFRKYYIYIPITYEPLLSKPDDWDDNYFNYYEWYIPEKDDNSPTYLLLTEEPNDWYDILTDDVVYGCNRYYTQYSKTNGVDEYSLLFSQPSDWDSVTYVKNSNEYVVWEPYTYYDGYTTEIIPGSSIRHRIYTLTSEEPEDWKQYYKYYYTCSGNGYYYKEVELYDSNSDFKRVISYDFSSEIQSKPSEKLLESIAREYMRKTTIINNSLNLDVSFVSLWQTEEYKNIAHLEQVNLCDIVTIDFPTNMNLESKKLKVIQTTFDVLLEKYTEIKLGNSVSSLSTTIAGIGETIKEEISSATSTLAESIARMVNALMGGRGGFMHVEYNGENQPCELIFGDTPDPETMRNCLRINYKGIAFSKDGMYGTYNSVWDLNGEFDGQCIKANSIDGSSIKANTIAADSLTVGARQELLRDIDSRLEPIEQTTDNIKSISSMIKIETDEQTGESRLIIGNGEVFLKEEVVSINGVPTAIISFFKKKDDVDYRVAYVSGEKFYSDVMQIGGYMIEGSVNADTGLCFNWIGRSEVSDG